MKATELMIGDWVIYAGEEIVKIHSIFGDGYADFYYTFEGTEYGPDIRLVKAKIKDFEPIPLTAEILEKNGWKEYPQIYSNQKTINFDIYRFEDEVGVKIQGYCMVLKYVHELQHALRLCELNELADNFQIV